MITRFYPSLRADLTLDSTGVVRGINHCQVYQPSAQPSPRLAAIEYAHQVAHLLDVTKAQLETAHQQVSYLEPREQAVQYRLSEEKSFFDSTITGLVQTSLNVPVWRAGITVTVKQNPNRIVSAVNTSQHHIKATLPDSEVIRKYQRLFTTRG